jgi:hypothetical protein
MWSIPGAGPGNLDARITEFLDPKGLREGMNRRDTQKDSLTQEGNDKTHDQLSPAGKFLFFLASFIKKRKRLKHQKHSDLVTTFLFLPPCILTASVLD